MVWSQPPLFRIKRHVLYSHHTPYSCWNVSCIFTEALMPRFIFASTSPWQISASRSETRFYLYCENSPISLLRIYLSSHVFIMIFSLSSFLFLYALKNYSFSQICRWITITEHENQKQQLLLSRLSGGKG